MVELIYKDITEIFIGAFFKEYKLLKGWYY